MDSVTSRREGPTQRRSLLPKRAGLKPTLTRLDSQGDAKGDRKGQKPATLEKTRASMTSDASQQSAKSMLPPTKPGRTRSVHNPAEKAASIVQPAPSTTRTRSTSKPPMQEHLVTPARERVSSAGSNLRTTGKAPLNIRSVSQQVESTATSTIMSMRRTSLRHSSLKTQRPALFTMQQKFIPKKPNKSRPVSPSSQTSREEDIPSADIFHLQMELAQLHLLHRSAAPVQAQWEHSARETFRNRFDALCERHVELKEIAHQQQTLINQLALVQWSQGKSGARITEKVQLLARNISDICKLLDIDGKYTRILEIFESWFTRALDIRGQREVKAAKAGMNLNFNEGIGDGWKAEAMVLERELTYCLRDITGFGTVRPTSSLGRILSLNSKMIVSLLEELDVIQWIENEIMVQETVWVGSTIHKLASNVSDDIGSIAPAR